MDKFNYMDIIVLMAGDGQRFVDAGYKTLKPLIKIGRTGSTILEWTLSSLKREILENNFITYAIREEHDKEYNLKDYLSKLYPYSDFKVFKEKTRGNLETAYLSSRPLNTYIDQPVTILDSDNYFSGWNLFDFISKIDKEYFAVICYFEPLDDSSKWCFAKIDENNRVKEIKEKDENALKEGMKPMIGTFYFNSSSMFHRLSKKILNTKQPVKNEYYMSQVINEYLLNEIPVYAYKAETMVPLGTPSDLENFK